MVNFCTKCDLKESEFLLCLFEDSKSGNKTFFLTDKNIVYFLFLSEIYTILFSKGLILLVIMETT